MDNVAQRIIGAALDAGATCAGIANIADLKKLPSYVMMPKRPHVDRVGQMEYETGLPEGVVAWPRGAKSVLVTAYFHPADKDYLDWWVDGKNPPGNHILIQIGKKVAAYIAENLPEIETVPLKYHVEKGGIWVKDAAVMAGIGAIGRNNLLVTPEYGPRVRLRAMALSADLPSTGPLDWDPCEGCPDYCRTSCPQNAFAEVAWKPEQFDGLEKLPGRDGRYDMTACDRQMKIDEANKREGEFEIPQYGEAHEIMPYCRRCELSCPVGTNGIRYGRERKA